jgi:hypothetical protein
MVETYLAIGVPTLFFALLVLASYWEKRLINPYVEINVLDPGSGGPPIGLLSIYVIYMSEGALAGGFQFDAMYAHRKYPMIKIGGTVWMSADRRTIMHTGSGTVANMPAKQTWLTTPCADGTWLITTDQNDEGDTSGTERIKRVLNVPFDKLLDAHLKRLATESLVVPFATGRAFDLLSDRVQRKYEKLVMTGLARYRGASREYWSHSATASLGAIWRFFKQFIGALPQALRGNRAPIGRTSLDVPLEWIQRWKSAAMPSPPK